MKESYREDLANHFGLEPYAVGGDIGGVASGRGNAGQLTQRVPGSEIINPVCRSCPDLEKATSSPPLWVRWVTDTAESVNLSMCGHSKRENREIPSVSASQLCISQSRSVSQRCGTVSEPLRGHC